jgi:hypothetical protein
MKAVKRYQNSIGWHPRERDIEEGVDQCLDAVKIVVQSLGGIVEDTEPTSAFTVLLFTASDAENLKKNMVNR